MRLMWPGDLLPWPMGLAQTDRLGADLRSEGVPRSETEWTALAQAGHPDAFNHVVEIYSARIYTHLFRLVRNREEAEDLTQETFIRAYRFIHQYDGHRPFRNWLYTIATNVGLNALRSRRRRGRFAAEPLHSDAAEGVPSRDNPRGQASLQELQTRLRHAIATLQPQAAVLVHLYYYENMSVLEAAEIVGLTESAAKVALHRARKRLRELLVEDDGF